MKNKKNNKLTKKNDKKVRDNKKNKIILIITTIIIVILLVLIITIFNGKTTIKCTKTTDNAGIVSSDVITFNMKNKRISSITSKKVLSISKNDTDVNYLKSVKETLEDTYKNIGVEYSIEQKENELIIDLTYEKKKEYILDNIFVNLENEGVSVNVISEDSENNYAKIDLNKEYSKENIAEVLEKAKFSCKY